ncbi:MAG TPA: hypothetical protein PLE33_01845 [Candidatus Cloacimonas sp.]|nr:hypothetical protein [Candidatus Cloacimonas sp.]
MSRCDFFPQISQSLFPADYADKKRGFRRLDLIIIQTNTIYVIELSNGKD